MKNKKEGFKRVNLSLNEETHALIKANAGGNMSEYIRKLVCDDAAKKRK